MAILQGETHMKFKKSRRVRFLISLSLLLPLIVLPIQAKRERDRRKKTDTVIEKVTSPKVVVAYGEFLDKITILMIKMERIKDQAKLKNVKNELDELMKTYNELIVPTNELKLLEDKLKKMNEALWEIEDAIRDKELKKEFDAEFINIARSVYYANDERCKVKREVNELLGSYLVEEKSYKDYK